MFIQFFLFGKPEWELDPKFTPTSIKQCGKSISLRLDEIADAVEKLQNANWETELMLYDIGCYNENIKTKQEAKNELENLGIDPDLACYMEDEEEEVDEEFESK